MVVVQLCNNSYKLLQAQEFVNLVIKVYGPHNWLLIPNFHTGTEVWNKVAFILKVG